MTRKNFNELHERVLERPGARERVARYRREMERELSLGELRRARELTQQQLAEALETNQSGISRLERQTDLYLSTLRSYVEALGGELEVLAVFHDGIVPIGKFEDLEEEPELAESSRRR
jgi:transcriptional regulator with XRE-family HTH domain